MQLLTNNMCCKHFDILRGICHKYKAAVIFEYIIVRITRYVIYAFSILSINVTYGKEKLSVDYFVSFQWAFYLLCAVIAAC